MTPDLTDILAYLATELLGWETVSDSTGQLWYRHDGRPMRRAREYMLTGNGMLEIIEAMRERGWHFTSLCVGGGTCSASFHGEHGDSGIQCCDTLPEAVARAAYAALKEMEKVDPYSWRWIE